MSSQSNQAKADSLKQANADRQNAQQQGQDVGNRQSHDQAKIDSFKAANASKK